MMHPLPSLFILLGSLDLVLSNALPQITNRAQKRDGGVLNINLGNLDVYTKTTVSLLSGKSVTERLTVPN